MGKENLVEADRKANVQKFNLPHFKKIAKVVMGEPPKEFKAKVHATLLEEKQAKEEKAWKQRKVEKERKKKEAERQKVIQENMKKAKEAAAKRKEETAKKIAEAKARVQAKKAEAAKKDSKDVEMKGTVANAEKKEE